MTYLPKSFYRSVMISVLISATKCSPIKTFSTIDRFLSRNNRSYWSEETKESIWIKIDFNSSRRISMHQDGRHSVLTSGPKQSLFRSTGKTSYHVQTICLVCFRCFNFIFSEDGWWDAENGAGKQGVVPKTLVEVINKVQSWIAKRCFVTSSLSYFFSFVQLWETLVNIVSFGLERTLGRRFNHCTGPFQVNRWSTSGYLF